MNGESALPADLRQYEQAYIAYHCQDHQNGSSPFGVLVVGDIGKGQRTNGDAQEGDRILVSLSPNMNALTPTCSGIPRVSHMGWIIGAEDRNLGGSRRDYDVDQGDDKGHTDRSSADAQFLEGQAGVVDDGMQDIALAHYQAHAGGAADDEAYKGHTAGAPWRSVRRSHRWRDP